MAPAISEVEAVKNGTISEYKNTTVSGAFEKRAQDPEWKSVVNQVGQKVVTFRGTVRYAALKEVGFYIGTWNGVLQGIEADLSLDRKSVEMTFVGLCISKVDPDHRLRRYRDATLASVYQ